MCRVSCWLYRIVSCWLTVDYIDHKHQTKTGHHNWAHGISFFPERMEYINSSQTLSCWSAVTISQDKFINQVVRFKISLKAALSEIRLNFLLVKRHQLTLSKLSHLEGQTAQCVLRNNGTEKIKQIAWITHRFWERSQKIYKSKMYFNLMNLSPRCVALIIFFNNPWMDVPGLCKTFLSTQAFDPC